tara:strand:+ start:887 stop:1078 length:192 start_codon:yes stop_codon:yes gene_type:complete
MKKNITLIVDHSSWWKAKKFRKESAIYLKKQKKNGWRLQGSKIIKKKIETIDTKTYKEFSLYK